MIRMGGRAVSSMEWIRASVFEVVDSCKGPLRWDRLWGEGGGVGECVGVETSS